MKILVTGGAGFIGSEFVRAALSGNYAFLGIVPTKIYVLDSLTYAGNLNNLDSVRLDPRFNFINGQVQDVALVDDLTKGIDIVINFAAESHVDRSINNPKLFLETNILGAQVIFESCLKNKVPKVIQISTDEVYGSINNGFATEEFPLLPNSPYSASKASADLIARAYFKTFKLPVIITRSCNNYGPYQNIEKVIPLFITNLIKGLNLPLYGNGENMREWINVKENCLGIAFVLAKGDSGEIYNIGGTEEISNYNLSKIIISAFGGSESLITNVADRKGHDFRYSVDSTKIRKIGFEPRVNLSTGIDSTLKWYRNNREWWLTQN